MNKNTINVLTEQIKIHIFTNLSEPYMKFLPTHLFSFNQHEITLSPLNRIKVLFPFLFTSICIINENLPLIVSTS